MTEQLFNACSYLLDRQVAAGDGGRPALTGPAGELSYAEWLDRVQRTATVLGDLGLQPEQRVLMFMTDSPDFVAIYLAAMRIGAIPVPVSTMLHADGLHELLLDSRARLLAVSAEFLPLAAEAVVGADELRGVLVAEHPVAVELNVSLHLLDELLATAQPSPAIYPTTADSPAFWLYTSGTTG